MEHKVRDFLLLCNISWFHDWGQCHTFVQPQKPTSKLISLQKLIQAFCRTPSPAKLYIDTTSFAHITGFHRSHSIQRSVFFRSHFHLIFWALKIIYVQLFDQLHTSAQKWANHMKTTGRFDHRLKKYYFPQNKEHKFLNKVTARLRHSFLCIWSGLVDQQKVDCLTGQSVIFDQNWIGQFSDSCDV